MGERKLDKLLGIKTVEIREWKDNKVQYNRYEGTPDKVLEILCENYKFKDIDRVVDFGCGRGRVAFYFHNRFHLPVIGQLWLTKSNPSAFLNGNLRDYVFYGGIICNRLFRYSQDLYFLR